MKTIIIAAIILFSVNATEAADTTATHKAPRIVPVRYFYDTGNRIPTQLIEITHERDSDPNGWKWDDWEWMQMKRGILTVPAYYNDPIHGSNNGIDWA